MSYLEKMKRALAARDKSDISDQTPQSEPLLSLPSLMSHQENTTGSAPHLDWANAMSLCLRCGWWGCRDDFAAHTSTDAHCHTVRNEELLF